MQTDNIERLRRVSDTLEWIDKNTIGIYRGTLERLAGVGLDVDDFAVPEDHFDEGRVWYSDFLIRATGLQKAVERCLTQLPQPVSATESTSGSSEAPVPNSVFIVHGQDQDAFDTVYALLREVELFPREFADARRLMQRPMPYIGEVLSTAFALAQAVAILFTPDERVELKDRLRGAGPIQVDFQPRPNVLIEAGIALATHPDRTVIVEMGDVRPISDLAGRHVVRWRDDSPAGRSELLDRLTDAGCAPNRSGSRWMDIGKIQNPTWR